MAILFGGFDSKDAVFLFCLQTNLEQTQLLSFLTILSGFCTTFHLCIKTLNYCRLKKQNPLFSSAYIIGLFFGWSWVTLGIGSLLYSLFCLGLKHTVKYSVISYSCYLHKQLFLTETGQVLPCINTIQSMCYSEPPSRCSDKSFM